MQAGAAFACGLSLRPRQIQQLQRARPLAEVLDEKIEAARSLGRDARYFADHVPVFIPSLQRQPAVLQFQMIRIAGECDLPFSWLNQHRRFASRKEALDCQK